MNIYTPDQQLIRAYNLGNEFAIEILINKYRKEVFRFIYHKVKDKQIADDIFQETFIKVIITLRKAVYDEKGKFLNWIVQIANNLVMDYFRMSKKRYLFSRINDYSNFGDDLTCDFLDIDELIKFEYNYLFINELIEKKLLQEQKEVLNFRFKEKMSFKEIASVQGVNINTALGRYRYAINNLRNEINKIKCSNIYK